MSDVHYIYGMRLECMICFDKTSKPINLFEDVETFDKYELERHLREKHTIEELLRRFTDLHWDMMLPPSVKYPDKKPRRGKK
jgi:hypothetical protein